MFFKIKADYILIGFFCIFNFSVCAQDQNLADSLAQIYAQDFLRDTAQLELLRNLSFNEVKNLPLALKYAEELISLSTLKNNDLYLFRGYLQKGYTKKVLGDLEQALEAFILAMNVAKKAKYSLGEGGAYCAIADIYNLTNHHSNAMLYYHKAIGILRQSEDSIALASAISNAGDKYLTYQDYDSALLYFAESGLIFEKINYSIGKAYNLGNIGMVYANIGQNDLAEKNINEAIALLEKSEDYYPICFYLISMSNIYLEKGDEISALNYAKKSLQLAQQYKLKQQISDANFKLSELYENIGKPQESLIHYKNHVAYRDSVNNLETIQNMADQRTEFEVNLREKEIDLLEKNQTLNRTYIIIALILLVLSIVVLLYFRQRFVNTKLISISERKQHDQKIKDLLNTQETKALQSMIKGQESERKRLAQELHNHFGSLMATIKVNINGIDEEVIPNHSTLTTLVDQACSDIRNMSHALNMGISEDFGLVLALKELTTHLRESGGIDVEFSSSMCQGQMDSDSEIVTYRIVQELVSNALKHAKPSKLSISLICFEQEKLINIIVEDNGKGFDAESAIKKSNGIGLQSLNKMITDQQGEFQIDSNPESGTTVTIDLPITIEDNLFGHDKSTIGG